MAQPPGQQPTQGSFGAPYDPPPESVQPPSSGYGSAPPPGQAAGPYGAPVQPGPYGTPAQPGPYNAPTQPGPYGYPSPQQPGYGYQQPQPQPQQPPRPGGGGFFRGRRGAVIGAVLAVVLLAGGGIWFATSGDDDESKPTAKASTDPGPGATGDGKAEDRGAHDLRAEADALNAQRKPGEAKVLWLQEGGVDLPRNGSDVYGPWIVGDTVVKAMFHTVSGYSVTDGSRKWSLRMPSNLCAAPSQPTADGKIVFGIKAGTADDALCNSLQMVDLTTGKAGWRKTYRRQGAWDLLSDVSMAINGDTVTVGRTSRTDAFRVSDGTVLFGELPRNCQPFGFASGPVAIAATSCQTAADDHKEQQVQRIDPVTGKVRWTYKVKKGWEVAQFYSVSPLVVSLKQEDKWAIIVLNENGTYRSQLVGGTDDYGTKCGGDLLTEGKNLDNCLGAAADDRTVYLATEPAESDLTPTNKVVAFDLNTGQAKWKAAAPAGQTLMPMRVEGGRLLMYLAAGKNKGGGIASLPPTGGTPQMVLRHPAAASMVERGFFDSRVVYQNGRCFLMHARISGIDDEDEKSMKSMAGFGS
ncbi:MULTISPECIES: PQQ-binding-like beta-propeller repeat protein [unclassified Streptomyces]|uniref:outer membrane protein assembly factor BamB family protein n=1 Tax=unclassified Streptomyces TaxID=2593676 RepID=UPI002DD9134A|nr:PQQ-binding-like beta-propeller repeat protein [Streptomyces sp. NBC_01761]WSC55426.1 PQQ-binding-like beta-propeller repeat protein [Streptomyces sp. NBC_01761]WSF86262.1 PQQ-binding-like beta-propeller repeat protein [Streptomyces sp. NBC_01744]